MTRNEETQDSQVEIIAKQSPDGERVLLEDPASFEQKMQHYKQVNIVRDREWQRNLVNATLKHGKFASYFGGGSVLLSLLFYYLFCGCENLGGWQYVAIVGIAAGLFFGLWHMIINSLKNIIK